MDGYWRLKDGGTKLEAWTNDKKPLTQEDIEHITEMVAKGAVEGEICH